MEEILKGQERLDALTDGKKIHYVDLIIGCLDKSIKEKEEEKKNEGLSIITK